MIVVLRHVARGQIREEPVLVLKMRAGVQLCGLRSR
jgi:hypothetical protein